VKTWIVIDVSFLCWRAFHSMGALSHKGVRTGVLYGVLRDIIDLQERFSSKDLIFVFDSRASKRKEIFPAYKQKRHSKDITKEEEMARFEVRQQIKALYKIILPSIGYANVWRAEGFEADDIIAAFVRQRMPADDCAVIVTADHDYYQLLDGRVSLYNPKGFVRTTIQSFHREYGIEPRLWAKVLSIAGCSTDEVPGVRGVGKLTALKFIRGELKPESAKYKAIVSAEGRAIMLRNRELVRLPFEGVPAFYAIPDSVCAASWKRTLDSLGIKSLQSDDTPTKKFTRKDLFST
jgi:DNA polymerase-1